MIISRHTILQLLEDHDIDTVFVPANYSGELQPLDLSVNKPVKGFLQAKYANEITEILIGPVKFPMSQMKPLGAQCLVQMYKYMFAQPEIMKNGFR